MSAAGTEIQSQAHAHTLAAAAAKAAPPVVVSGATIAGVGVNEIVLWLTAVYLVIQIAHLAWKWCKEAREK
jgi:hypothetical protein